MKDKWLRIVTCGLLAALLMGCAAQLQNLRIGMTKEQVRRAVGEPKNVIESSKIGEDKIGEVWEYSAGRGGKKFWVYIIDGRVEKWHMGGETWVSRPVMPKSAK